ETGRAGPPATGAASAGEQEASVRWPGLSAARQLVLRRSRRRADHPPPARGDRRGLGREGSARSACTLMRGLCFFGTYVHGQTALVGIGGHGTANITANISSDYACSRRINRAFDADRLPRPSRSRPTSDGA